MKKVIVRYPVNETIGKDRKFKISASQNGEALRRIIVADMPQFRNVDFFLILQGVDGQFLSFNEKKNLEDISPAKHIRLHLFLKQWNLKVIFSPFKFKQENSIYPSSQDQNSTPHFHMTSSHSNSQLNNLSNARTSQITKITDHRRDSIRKAKRVESISAIETILETKTVQIDLQEPVSQNIRNFIETMSNEHLIFNDPKDYTFVMIPKNETPQICASSLPLIFQGWSLNEPIYLLYTFPTTESINTTDTRKLEFIYNQCKLAIYLKLCSFSLVQWASLACLENICENHSMKNSTINELLTKYIPDYLQNNEAMQSILENTTPQFLNPVYVHHAMKEFIELFVLKGISFCFIDRVKFLLVSKKKLSSHRYLYISQYVMTISKNFGVDFLYQQPTASIREIKNDGTFVMISFNNGEKWRIRSDFHNKLIRIIEDMRRDGPTVVVPRLVTSNPIDDDDNDVQKEAHVRIKDVDLPDVPEDVISDVSRVCEIDQFNNSLFHEPNDDVSMINDDDDGEIKLGLSKIICPKNDDCETPYSPESEMYRDLKIIKQLKLPPIKSNSALYPVPDLSFIDFESRFSISQPLVQLILGLFAVVIVVLYRKS